MALLLIGLWAVTAAGPAGARGGGGCFLPETPILHGDGTALPISRIRAGAPVMAFRADASLVTARVNQVVTQPENEYYVVTTDRTVLNVTAEHPFCIGAGTFQELRRLKTGDTIMAFDGQGLIAQRILNLERRPGAVTVYNLRTDRPHTFFAAGAAVHNKGGGGCFLAATPILRADGSSLSISRLKPDDRVLAFREDAAVVTASVNRITARPVDEYYVLQAGRAVLQVTAEHPFYIAAGTFKTAASLKPGDRVLAFDGSTLSTQYISQIKLIRAKATVYNLETDEPHTFFAAGVAVHNKGGGGGGGGGFRSSSRRSSAGSKSDDPVATLIVTGFMVGMLVIFYFNAKQRKKNENLDFCYARGAISKKADKTRKLLDFLARQDAMVRPELLEQTAKNVFLKLQQCWQDRHYDPMKPLLMPDLYNQHLQQIRGLIRNHEINRLENIRVDHIDLVNLRYTHKDYQREFTALITATIRDYYVDDRTQAFLRGDDSAAQFQEFWTFQLQNGQWLLRAIEQTRESDALKDENFMEAFTDAQLEQIYGEAVDKTGPIGPWLEKTAANKALQIERMLNFLYETDKLWNRQLMLECARRIFTDVYMTYETGQLSESTAAQLFPAIAQKITEEINSTRAKGWTIAYRNFCVRKVELLLVRNFSDNRQDEYFTRISAHAQTSINQHGQPLRQDEDVLPFEEYWTFGRLANQWKLKDILPPAGGRSLLQQENLDEESSPDQVQWYYTKKRTV